MTPPEFAQFATRYKREFLLFGQDDAFVLAWRPHFAPISFPEAMAALTALHGDQSEGVSFVSNHCRILLRIIAARRAEARRAEEERRRKSDVEAETMSPAEWQVERRKLLQRIGRIA